MAGPYFVDDGGNGSDGLSWANAETSINDLDTAVAFASGEIVYFGADSVCQATNSAHLTITGPTSGTPVLFISATQGSNPVAYSAATANQIDTSEGAYDLIFDGSITLRGMQTNSGGDTKFVFDTDELFSAENCRFKIGAAKYLRINGAAGGRGVFRNCTVDLSADGTTNRSQAPVISDAGGVIVIQNMAFVNAGYRTGSIFDLQNQYVEGYVSGCDLSSFPSTCEILGFCSSGTFYVANCITGATWTPLATLATQGQLSVQLTNCGPADAPTYIYCNDWIGTLLSSGSIYRTGGATVEGDACSWLITTTTQATETTPFYTPWIYGTVGSTGSKTFDLYITNDTADFTDAECWLEVEYLSTSDEAIWALATDQRATITATAAAQTDDTTSTWNGTGPSFTYKQKLSVTATVGETGQYRARVAVGVASIAGSRYFYVDPKVTVS